MVSYTSRAAKGSPLTNAEMDANWNAFNDGKVETTLEIGTLTAGGLQGGGQLTTNRNLALAINGLTADASPATDDYFLSYDTSASAHKKVLLSSIKTALSLVKADVGLGNVDNVAVLGKQALYIPATAMIARTTNGAAAGTVETTTNKIMLKTLDYDTSTVEYAQFSICMPKKWNEGTVTFRAVWSHASTTTNFGVAFSLAGVAISDDDAGDAAFGTAVTVTDTGGTTNDIYRTAESSAVTIAGTPQAEDWVVFQVARETANASDNMAIDARLLGIVLYITTDAGNDA